MLPVLTFLKGTGSVDSDGLESDHNAHIFYLDDIPVLEDRAATIATDRLTNKKFLVKGSNSVLDTAKMNGQKVVIKQIRADHVDNEVAEREFKIEHDMLSRLKYVIIYSS